MDAQAPGLEGDSSKFCVFCYRFHPGSKTEKHEDPNLNRFFRLIQRYLRIPVDTSESFARSCATGQDDKFRMEPCELCNSIVTQFNDLYHEVKCLEMKLQLQIHTLISIMNDAGKVRSRRRQLRSKFGEDKYREFGNGRKRWIENSSKSFLNIFPVVKLEKKRLLLDESVEHVSHDQQCITEFAKIWLISLTTVGLLLIDNLSCSSVSEISSEGLDYDVDQFISKSLDGVEKKWEPSELSVSSMTTERSLASLAEASIPECHQESTESELIQVQTRFPNQKVELELGDDFNLMEETMTTSLTSDAMKNSAVSNKDGSDPVFESLQEDVAYCEIEVHFDSSEAEDPAPKRIRLEITDSQSAERAEDLEVPREPTQPLEEKLPILMDCEHPITEDEDDGNVSDGCSTLSSHFSDDFETPVGAKSPQNLDGTKSLPENLVPTTTIVKDSENNPVSCKAEMTPQLNIDVHSTARRSPPRRSPQAEPGHPSREQASKRAYNLRKRSMPKPAESSSSDSEDEYINDSDSNSTGTSDNDDEITFKPANTKGRRVHYATTVDSFTAEQLSDMEREFQASEVLDKTRQVKLAEQLNLTRSRLCIWWNTRRAESKQDVRSVGLFEKIAQDLVHAKHNRKLRKTRPKKAYVPVVPIPKNFRKLFYCNLDGCIFKTKEQDTFESHRKLHKPGEYTYQFCNTTEPTPMLLSLHEADNHSIKLPGVKKIFCPRCPFTSSFQIVFVNHFATDHMNITDLPSCPTETCSLCHLEVKFPKRHFRIVHDTKGKDPSKIMNCPEESCESVFISRPGLQRHLMEYHNLTDVPEDFRPKLKCKDCTKTFQTEAAFMTHKRFFHDRIRRCPREGCKFACKHQPELDLHSKLHGTYQCSKCTFHTDFLPVQMDHDAVCLNLRSLQGYSCPDCELLTKYIDDFIDHRIETHLGLTRKVFKCSVCSEAFISDDRRRKHFSTVHKNEGENGQESFQCSECPMNFTKRIQLACHRRLKHKVAQEWNCKHCGINLTTKHSLIRHIHRKHKEAPVEAGRKLFTCDYIKCNRGFETEDDLLWHKTYWCVKQRKAKRYPCSVCDKTFKLAKVLKRHLKSHRPNIISRLKCDHCSKTFLSRKCLNLHKQYHKDPAQWKYTCTVCSSKFVLKSDLEKHVNRAHKIKKEFKCEDCEETVYSKRSYKEHRLQVHDKHSCPVKWCSQSFPEKEDAEKHFKLHGDFKCKKCKFQTKFVYKLKEHEIDCMKLKKSQRFKCPECVFIGKSVWVLVDHRLETHLGVSRRIFDCKICGDNFATPKGRRLHVRTYHGMDVSENSKRCDKCPAYFLHADYLKDHLRFCKGPNGDTSEKKKLFCDMCSEQFLNKEEFENHGKFHGIWKCKFCPAEEFYASDLAVHEMQVHGREASDEDPLGGTNCPRCDWKGVGNTKLTRVIQMSKHFVSKHLGLNPRVYLCEICQTGYFTRSVLRSHSNRYHKVERNDKDNCFKCGECPAYFSRRNKLLLHRRSKHMRLNHYQCKHCGKNLKSETTLKNHVERMHNLVRDRNYSCDHPKCGKAFENEEDLVYHQRWCAKTKSKLCEVICQICGKVLVSEQGLKQHMKVHKPGRPTEFKCDICSKVFRLKAQLKGHQEFHKGPEEWKFMCAVCSKKCVDKYKLEEHMRTHTKEKPFVCQVCGEKYAHKHNLQNHIKSKHKEVKLETKKHFQRHHVSRKGKKLGTNFCFTKAKDMGEDSEDSSGSSD